MTFPEQSVIIQSMYKDNCDKVFNFFFFLKLLDCIFFVSLKISTHMIYYAFYLLVFYFYMSTLYIKNPDLNCSEGCTGISSLKTILRDSQ